VLDYKLPQPIVKHSYNVAMPFATIVIVTWNSAAHLPRCLSSLSEQTFRDFEVIIVDNGSADDSYLYFHLQYPNLEIKIKRLKSNIGFAAANNIGVDLAQGQWLVFLNADAFPGVDWLEQLLSSVHKYPAYACFSSRQIQEHDRNLLDGEGDAYHISGLAWRRNYGQVVYEAVEPAEIFSACGAAMMVWKQDFIDLGGFDESYFSYFEDVDLGFRLRLMGKKVLYIPQAVVFHVGSASTGRRSDFAVYYEYRNLIWTYYRNMPFPFLQLFLVIHIIALFFFILYITLRGQGPVIWRAIFDAARNLPGILEKRREIQSKKKVSSKDIISSMSKGIFDPLREFIKRNKKL